MSARKRRCGGFRYTESCARCARALTAARVSPRSTRSSHNGRHDAPHDEDQHQEAVAEAYLLARPTPVEFDLQVTWFEGLVGLCLLVRLRSSFWSCSISICAWRSCTSAGAAPAPAPAPAPASAASSAADPRPIRNMHIKRCNSLGEMIGPVAPPWASVLCRLGV